MPPLSVINHRTVTRRAVGIRQDDRAFQMSALAILSQPRKRSVVQISESRPGHFASIRRLPN